MLEALNRTPTVFRACKGAMHASALPLFERAQEAGEVTQDVAWTTCCG